MLDFEFLGTLHRTSKQMHDAIAEEWLAAGGLNTRHEALTQCRQSTERLANDAIEALGLSDVQGFDHKELIDAFSRLKRQLDSETGNSSFC